MANDKPNILIFFTDMQRADTIRALGNTVIRTPNLDRLVAEGTAFSNCFSPSPVCVPARCCMHYGLYPQKTGLFDNGTMMPDNGASYPEMRMMKAYYYASISFVDFQIGRVLDALEASGQLDCTLILFASDHGELLGDFNCFGKRSMHDASVRVPLIARYPARFRAGRTCQTAVSLVDLYPTVLSAAGVDAAARTSDGLDLATVARRGSSARTVFSQFSQAATGLYMAANTDWKYVHSTGDGCDFLFDRHADPSETVNLAASRKVAVIKEELKQALLRHLKICGRSEAYVERGGCLHWRRYARINEDYLKTPDARLLLQDYPSYALNLPGYM